MDCRVRGFRTQALVLVALAALLTVARAEGTTRSWAQPQIERVVADGLMAPSVATFRPDDPLLGDELAQLLPSLAPVDPATTTTTETTPTETIVTTTDPVTAATVTTPAPAPDATSTVPITLAKLDTALVRT